MLGSDGGALAQLLFMLHGLPRPGLGFETEGLEGVGLGSGLLPGEGTPPLQVSLHLQSPAFTWNLTLTPILHPPGAAHLAPIGCLSVCWGSGWRLAGTLQIPTASGCRKIQFSS